jgi:predicted TIM-barrel fold metal-dependent hydrolase
MLDNFLIADATCHAYNWAPSNWNIPVAETTTGAGWGLHNLVTVDPDLMLTQEEFVRDWPAEDVSDTLFFEGGIDIICHHGTPIFDFYKDGHSDTEKGFTIRDQYPDRTVVYGAINPFSDGDKWIEDMDYLVKEKKVDGLKIYAARYEEGRTIEQRLDDPEFGYPFIQRALDLGVKVIATHKGIPFGPVRMEAYGVRDVPEACAIFPEMNFEVVHSGWAFMEETVPLAFFPNCWFNLETCWAVINRQPARFAGFLAGLIGGGGGDRIMYASGMAIGHPLPSLQAFLEMEMPKELQDGYGIPPLTEDLKRGILGENFMRLHGIDPAEFRAKVADDEVSRRQAEGLAAPWSHMRSRAAAAA